VDTFIELVGMIVWEVDVEFSRKVDYSGPRWMPGGGTKVTLFAYT